MADWDERYRRGEHATSEPSKLLVRGVKDLAPGRGLDVACGAGRHALFLASHGWNVTAVDSSQVGIDILSERARAAGVIVNSHLADLERDEFQIDKDFFDLICVFYFLQRDLFPKLIAGLRVGGTLIAAIHMVDESQDIKPMNPDFLLQPGELRDIFREFEIVQYHEAAGHDTDRGDHIRRTAEIIALKK